mmetsp:Transcript_33433/g.51320  ORF Transcript_33433/g.51320 Transcript_33433/m.51320 type:complete len:418 (-) Transcript_33433:1242-2495(-)
MEEREKLQQPDEKQIADYLQHGDFVYELFSILIHSGGAMGGHYYAYIKSFEDGLWYNFNDSNVSRIPDKEVKDEISKMFGGDNATSAYQLQYRRTTLKEEKFDDNLIPDYLKEEINQETEEALAKLYAEQEKLLTLHLKIYEPQERDAMRPISAKKTWTFKELLTAIKKEASPDFCGPDFAEVKDSNVRLLMYNPQMKVGTKEFGSDDAGKTLADLHIFNFLFKIEIKSDDETFTPINPNAIYLKVFNYSEVAGFLEARDGTPIHNEGEEPIAEFNYSDLDSYPMHVVSVDPTVDTVGDLEDKVSVKLGIEKANVKILIRHYFDYNNFLNVEYLNMGWANSKKLCELKTTFDIGSPVFVEDCPPEVKYEKFKWRQAIVNEHDLFRLHIYTEAVKSENELGECSKDVVVVCIAKTKKL